MDHLDLRKQFQLNFDITFLNHGSFGACPIPVFEDYQHWQKKLEQEPVQFMVHQGPKVLNKSRETLAKYLDCDPMDMVYVPNPTTAMNIVIKSLPLKEGDEVLMTDQEYGAIDKVWDYYAERAGAKIVRQKIHLPIRSKEETIKQFWSGLSNKTKYVFLSQITSATALIYPAQEICQKAKELGLITIIDGAHVPGHIPLSLNEMQADIYTGTCHKWILSPKGSSFLYASPEMQQIIDPLIISWGYKSPTPSSSLFHDYFDYNGTKDISAYLTSPVALQFLEDYNWEERKQKCRLIQKHYYPIISKQLGGEVLCPLSDEYLGQISSSPIKTNDPVALQALLYHKYKIEIPVTTNGNHHFLRVSYQAYNSAQEIEYLLDCIKNIQQTTSYLS